MDAGSTSNHGEKTLKSEHVHKGSKSRANWTALSPSSSDELLIAPVLTFMSSANMNGKSHGPDSDQDQSDNLHICYGFATCELDSVEQEDVNWNEVHEAPGDVDD